MKRLALLAFCIFSFGNGFGGFAHAMPAQVLIIRHGEKPHSGGDLNAQGRERAQKLIQFFKTNPQVNAYGKIAKIYAMSPDDDDEDDSNRSIQTVTPTAEALNIPMNRDFKKKKVDKLYKDIKNDSSLDDKTVLICWEHKWIPEIAKAFGLHHGPDHWDGDDVFDRMWSLTFDHNGDPKLKNYPEHVLSGDSN